MKASWKTSLKNNTNLLQDWIIPTLCTPFLHPQRNMEQFGWKNEEMFLRNQILSINNQLWHIVLDLKEKNYTFTILAWDHFGVRKVMEDCLNKV